MTDYDTTYSDQDPAFDPSYEVSSDEDAPTVSWVDSTIEEAEAGGYLHVLADHVEQDAFVDPQEYQRLVEQARADGAFDGDEPEFVPPVSPDRDAIREQIFAKLRRPDGAPFAAGYVSGPAARKPMYETEQTAAGAWRLPRSPDSDARTTRYDDRDTLADRAASVHDGRVIDPEGNPYDGTWGWVIDDATGSLMLFAENAVEWFDQDGNPYVRDSWETLGQLLRRGYKVRGTHHTSPVAGLPVTGAGVMVLENGVITDITDESGHYRPDAAQEHAAVQALLAQGYSLEQARMKLTGDSMGERPTDKAGWLGAAQADNPAYPTGDVSLRVDQFAQTGGDEYQIRAKQAVNDQIGARGERPGTEIREGMGTKPHTYDVIDGDSLSEDSLGFSDEDSSSESEGDEDPRGAPVREELFVGDNGVTRRRVYYADGSYNIVDLDDVSADDPGRQVVREEAFVGDDGVTRRRLYLADGSYTVEDYAPGSAPGPGGQPQGGDPSRSSSSSESESESSESESDGRDLDGDSSAEDADDTFVAGARAYLASAGRNAFADWFRQLPVANQDTLLADPEIGAVWREENAAPPPPAWQPAEADQATAATANAAFVDSLDDRESAVFTLGGFSLLIGDGHDDRHAAHVDDAPDRVTGTVTVRKAGLGRASGSLLFTGVPPAKQGVVTQAVRRFSRKDVRFG